MLTQTQANLFGSTSILLLAVIVIGGIVAILSTAALLRRQVVVDSDGNVTEIKIPFFGKMKTTYPAAGTAFLGVVLVAFAITRIPDSKASEPLVPFELEVKLPDDDSFKTLSFGAIPSTQWKSLLNLPDDGIIRFEVPGNKTYFGVALMIQPGAALSKPVMSFKDYQAEVRGRGFYAKADFSITEGESE